MSGGRRLAVVGDANRVATWSGIPYHLLEEGKLQGFFEGGLALRPERFRRARLLWNARMLATTGRWGGFQYSEPFLERLFAEVEPGGEIVSHFPLLPPSRRLSGWRVSYYIDATLQQNFRDYGLAARLHRRVRQDALAREREAYGAAERVVCMSRWAATSVIDEYGVERHKVHVVRPGANLPRDIAASGSEAASKSFEPYLRLGFIGKDWRRKWLPRLLAVAEALERLGTPTRVVAIGVPVAEGQRHRLLERQGFIDKEHEIGRFVDALRSFHFGCLLSSVEALGISTLECLRVGVPVVGTRVGGIVDAIDESVGALVEPEDSPEAIAERIRLLVAPDRYRQLRLEAARRSEEYSWCATVHRLRQVWGEAA